MKLLKCLSCLLVCFVVLTGAASGKTLAEHATELQKALSKDNVRAMIQMAGEIKNSGASYQSALTTPASLAKRVQPGEELRVLIGMYQFDAAYAAAFGHKAEAAEFMNARAELMSRMNLQGRMDISALFPPEIITFVRSPDLINFDKLVDIYAEQAENYVNMTNEPLGYDTVESSVYGFVLEGLYVSSNSVLNMGLGADTKVVMMEAAKLIRPLLGIYKSFTTCDHYAKFVDPENFLEFAERSGWLKMLLKLIVDNDGDLSERQIEAIVSITAKERAAVFAAN